MHGVVVTRLPVLNQTLPWAFMPGTELVPSQLEAEQLFALAQEAQTIQPTAESSAHASPKIYALFKTYITVFV